MKIRSIQRGTITIASSAFQSLSVISAFDPAHAYALKLGQEGVGGVQDNDIMIWINTTGGNTVAANRGFNPAHVAIAEFEVIEEWPL